MKGPFTDLYTDFAGTLGGGASVAPLVKAMSSRPNRCTVRSTAARMTAVGPITVNCDVLEISDRDQQVVFYSAPPGSPAEEALRLLSVLGTQTIMLEDGTAAR
ncbi:MmyB family transcriptional regulator [Amycolatopsis panacis]|uniref:MmyB family transcriptional regulator n=1 Tax=Amycolatopsis panacis TaxID=2340917 RepID=UPI002D776ECA|nr:hypothetical protein [Amycolatopsis panacis]